MLENVGNAITRLPMDRLARNLGGRIQRTPLRKTVSSVLVVTANRTVNVLVYRFMRYRDQKYPRFGAVWMTLCHCVTKKIW